MLSFICTFLRGFFNDDCINRYGTLISVLNRIITPLKAKFIRYKLQEFLKVIHLNLLRNKPKAIIKLIIIKCSINKVNIMTDKVK